jgi:hypothetical protein
MKNNKIDFMKHILFEKGRLSIKNIDIHIQVDLLEDLKDSKIKFKVKNDVIILK